MHAHIYTQLGNKLGRQWLYQNGKGSEQHVWHCLSCKLPYCKLEMHFHAPQTKFGWVCNDSHANLLCVTTSSFCSLNFCMIAIENFSSMIIFMFTRFKKFMLN